MAVRANTVNAIIEPRAVVPPVLRTPDTLSWLILATTTADGKSSRTLDEESPSKSTANLTSLGAGICASAKLTARHDD